MLFVVVVVVFFFSNLIQLHVSLFCGSQWQYAEIKVLCVFCFQTLLDFSQARQAADGVRWATSAE
jgi:hypothetical protein